MSLSLSLRAAAIAAALFAAAPAWAQPGPPSSSPDEALAGEEAPAPAPRRERRRPRLQIDPYVELNGAASVELSGGDGDAVSTYGSVAAGVDARVATRRVQAQASYRYDRRLPVGGDVADEGVHSGVAMVHAEAAPGVSVDAGALATRSGGPGRVLLSDRDAATEVYSAFVGPTLNRQIGPVSVGAAYRLGYVRIDNDDDLAGDLVGSEGYDSAIAHNATASIGMGPGRLPFGWTVGGGYVREESGEFENVFEAMYVRGDIVVPVGPTLALTAGIGYENIDASQQDVLRNANGVPILVGGRPVADPTRPRLSGFGSSGLIYDGGIIWRPTPRTELQARAGRRYGGTTVTGSLRHRFNGRYAVNASVYDTMGTSATSIVNNVNALPTDFQVNRNPLTGAFDGCVFGRDPGTGICFDQALAVLSNTTFRARGANLFFSGSRGLWDFGLGGSYAHRRYFSLVSGDIGSIDPRVDHSFVLNAGLGRRLSRSSGLSLDVSTSWFDSDRASFQPAFSTGFTSGIYRRFLLDRLQLHAAFGLFYTDAELADSTVLSGLLGLRYTF